ncbi:DNA-directed RNA polymerase II subunit GRINL1A-like isoform X2 [Anneissia japonica]|nr:DNA-directed RNA polymerase II subunit GRINL1A-like isoform X2 [Anneissia japonica]XP_033124033.1 DNA-directed RNA polymerase II subunit GRINL1A-like isoform X2 [Anneissia japonica]XP_033124034.1 DNA-directed RNA polymerase II subunit GRINL1A-like isoform X2 [Anneissia japonica]
MEFKQNELPEDLQKLTNQELADLLRRQEKILKNKSCMSRLPDKGQKIQLFKQKLENILTERENVDEAAEMLQKMDLQTSKQLADESKGSLTKEKNISIDATTAKSPFKPSQSLRSKAIPANVERPQVMSSKGNSPSKSQAHKVSEYSNVVSPLGKFEKTKELPLEESHKLLVEQKEKYEDLQAQQAAERLAERMHLTLGDYEPQADDAYRETGEVSSGEDEETGNVDLSDLIDET